MDGGGVVVVVNRLEQLGFGDVLGELDKLAVDVGLELLVSRAHKCRAGWWLHTSSAALSFMRT